MNDVQIAETPAIAKLELPAPTNDAPTNDASIKRAVALYPKVFRQRVRPLKIGIRWDLIDAGAPPKAVSAALERYVSTREYYLACRRGAKRYNMYGCPEGCVSALEQTYADERLAVLDMIAGCRP